MRCVVEDYLHQNFVLLVRSPRFCTNTVNAIETDRLCNKCRHKCRNILRRKQILDINYKDDTEDPTFRSPKRSKCIQVHVSSPPSIALLLPSSSRSHSYFLSAKNLAQSFCQLVLIKHGWMYLSGARCCADHLISA